MDNIDLKILDILQAEGRITMKELGQRVGLTSPATIERVKKLEEGGVIGGYKAIINIKRAGLPIRAFILVRMNADKNPDEMVEFAQKHESILQCHRVAGGSSHLMEAALANFTAVEQLLGDIGNFGQVEPLLVLSSPVEHKSVVLP